MVGFVGEAAEADSPTSPVMSWIRQTSRDTKTSRVSRCSENMTTQRTINVAEHFGTHQLFADADGIKEFVKASMATQEYSVATFYKETGCWQAVARSSIFDQFTLIVIAVNAIWVAVDTDYNKPASVLEVDIQYQIADNLFAVYFTFEWLVRFMAFQYKRNCFKDAWFVIDSFLMLLTVFDTWVMLIMLRFSSSGSTGNSSSIFRLVRLIRILRVARMARLIKTFPELVIIIKGVAAAARSVFFTLALLFALSYVAAIMFTQLMEGTPSGAKYFSNVPYAFYTLIIHGTIVDNVSIVLAEIADDGWHLVILFLVYVFLAAFTLMNMLIGVLCEVVSGVAAVEREQGKLLFVENKLGDVVRSFDENGDNMISKTEFELLVQDKGAIRALEEVGVDVSNLIDLGSTIFCDEQGPPGNTDKELPFPSFMDVIFELRGSNAATVQDLVHVKNNLRQVATATSSRLDILSDKVDTMQKILVALAQHVQMPGAERLKSSPKNSPKRRGGGGGGGGGEAAGPNRGKRRIGGNVSLLGAPIVMSASPREDKPRDVVWEVKEGHASQTRSQSQERQASQLTRSQSKSSFKSGGTCSSQSSLGRGSEQDSNTNGRAEEEELAHQTTNMSKLFLRRTSDNASLKVMPALALASLPDCAVDQKASVQIVDDQKESAQIVDGNLPQDELRRLQAKLGTLGADIVTICQEVQALSSAQAVVRREDDSCLNTQLPLPGKVQDVSCAA